jgi:DNA-binding XRE family transcriptional regulator
MTRETNMSREPVSTLKFTEYRALFELGEIAICQAGHWTYTDTLVDSRCPECFRIPLVWGRDLSPQDENEYLEIKDRLRERISHADGYRGMGDDDPDKAYPSTPLGSAVYSIRRQLSLSHRDLANVLGVAKSSIHALESGERESIQPKTAAKFRAVCEEYEGLSHLLPIFGGSEKIHRTGKHGNRSPITGLRVRPLR